MKKEMLINVLQPEECRIAIVEDGVLEELYVERTSQESYVGNIYKGRIVNIEPSIQAAFVDFGIGRNGFLHVSDVDPAYYQHLAPLRSERRDRDGDRGRGRGRGDRRGGRGRGPRRHEPREPIDYPPTVYDEPAAPSEPAPAEGASVWGAALEILGLDVPAPRDPQNEPARTAEPLEPATPEPPAVVPPPDRPRVMESAARLTHPPEPAGPFGAGILEQSSVGAPAPSDPSDDDTLPEEPIESADEIDDPTPVEFDGAEIEPEAWDDAVEVDESLPESAAIYDLPPSDGASVLDEIADERFDEEEDPFDVEFEDGEVPQPRSRPRERDRRGGRGRGPRRGGRPSFGRPKPLIQDIFKRGQEVIVQVIKEGIGTKGPTLSTYVSIAGRYLVLMPGLNRIGVSRKIQDEEARRRLKEILTDLRPPKGLGFIIRTAGIDRNKKELQNDLNYLLRLWQVMVRRIRKLKSPAEIYQESDMITRTIRDTFTSDIDVIWVDESNAFAHAEEFSQIVMPRYADRIKHYQQPEPLFHRYGIEEEIARIQQKKIPLPMGGSIVIEQTEALVAIDVNSGNFRADNNAEETAYQMNLQAAKEIARQLRLRDLGGVIVNDFIDMREEKHKRGVERAMRDALKRDRARTKILKISQFGLIEMTRQRIRPSLKRSTYHDCPFCGGSGHVKTGESMSIEAMRLLQLAGHRDGVSRIQVRVHVDVAHYLLNRKRKEIAHLEESGEMQVSILGVPTFAPEQMDITCYDRNGNELKFHSSDAAPSPRLPERGKGRYGGR